MGHIDALIGIFKVLIDPIFVCIIWIDILFLNLSRTII